MDPAQYAAYWYEYETMMKDLIALAKE